MRYLYILIKPSSSLCNLNCTYCFYRDVYSKHLDITCKFMNTETSHCLIDKVFDYCKEETSITFAFQGGEPLLSSIEFYEDFINYVKLNKKENHLVNYTIQTNGTLINERWVNFFKENKVLVGISLDGFEENHNLYRKDNNGNGSFKIIKENIEILKNANVDFNILTVLTTDLAKKPNELFKFYVDNGYDYIQIIPCLKPFESDNNISLKPKDFFDFYNIFFDRWYELLTNGKYISINYFDNVIRLFNSEMPNKCGALGKCSLQLVSESNGDLYPCDFYALDKYCLGNVVNDSFEDIIRKEVIKKFINEDRKLSNECNNCKFYNICYGNCKRESICYYDEDYCALKEFMETKEEKLKNVMNIIEENKW